MAAEIREKGGEIWLNEPVQGMRARGGRIDCVRFGSRGDRVLPVDYVFSSAPISHTLRALEPLPPKAILDAAQSLYFRGHITVNHIVRGDNLFPDNWLYIHSPEVKMARIANYNNFSRDMIGHPDTSAVSQDHFQTLYRYAQQFSNLCLIGRAGMYRYNNQDHALLSGFYAARNYLNLTKVDLMGINDREETIEEKTLS
ncbi:MAG: hypothetical protein HYY14_00950 [Candidatus Omnitrophica bacterium]|nr:hypothetical protein [Candidatus Omnitrophota bacterium]